MERPVKEVIADLDLARATERISSVEHAKLVAEVRASAVDGIVAFDSSALGGKRGSRAVPDGRSDPFADQRTLEMLVPGGLVSALLKGAAVLVGLIGTIYVIVMIARVGDLAGYDTVDGFGAIAATAVRLVAFALSCLAAATIIDLLRYRAIRQEPGVPTR